LFSFPGISPDFRTILDLRKGNSLEAGTSTDEKAGRRRNDQRMTDFFYQKSGKEITFSDEETTQSDKKTTFSDEETTKSDEEITFSDEETTKSDEETTFSDEETTQSDDEMTFLI